MMSIAERTLMGSNTLGGVFSGGAADKKPSTVPAVIPEEYQVDQNTPFMQGQYGQSNKQNTYTRMVRNPNYPGNSIGDDNNNFWDNLTGGTRNLLAMGAMTGNPLFGVFGATRAAADTGENPLSIAKDTLFNREERPMTLSRNLFGR